jgi:Smg protein
MNGLLNLNADNIDVDDLQWLALIILFSQPEEEQAFASMESLMFDPPVDHEH